MSLKTQELRAKREDGSLPSSVPHQKSNQMQNSEFNVVRVNTSAWEEEDFYVLSTLTEYQIRVVILAMVLKERAADELLYDNEDYVAALREAYPTNVIKWYSNFDTITI